MDHRVVEPSRLVVAARRDVAVSLRYERDEAFYFVEDGLRNRFFRLGPAEYALFRFFDGRRTVADAVAAAAGELGARAPSVDDAVALANWLVASGLANVESGATPAAIAAADRRRQTERRRRRNPWFFRVNLGDADRFLARIEPFGRLLFRRETFVAWVCAVAFALVLAATGATRIAAAAPIDFGRWGVVRLFVVWCLLKAVHEAAHGLACRSFGARVGNWGVAFTLGMPSPFIDVSSAWRLDDRRLRIIMSLAGIYAETFIAACAIFVWSISGDAAVQQTAITVAAMASVTTLLFNLNPLMRFDGYFALSDWAGLPNMATTARDECRRLVRRYFLGIDEPPIASARRPRWLPWYGLAAFGWNVFIAASMLLLALARFGIELTIGLSILPACYAASAWRSAQARRRANSVAIDGPRNVRRMSAAYACVAVGVVAAMWLYDPRTIRIPAVVDYDPLTVVRAETPGFVERILVADGDEVAAGQLLAELRNDDLLVEVEQAENLVQQSLARSRVHRQSGEIAKEQAEAVRRTALEIKRNELRRRREGLSIRAPAAGRIVSRGAARLVGFRLDEGDELVSLGVEARKVVVAALSQGDSAAIRAVGSVDLQASLSGRRGSLPVDRFEVDPQATQSLIHPALSIDHGGEMPVRRRTKTERPETGETTLAAESCEPRFRLEAALASADALQVHAGRTAALYVRTGWSDLALRYGAWLNRKLNDILRR